MDFVKKFLHENKGENITVIEVDENFCEFEHIVVVTGSSSRQVVALSEKLKENVKKFFKISCNVEGKENAEWVLLDYINVVVHIFQKQVRDFYKIEELWGDCKTNVIPIKNN